MSPAPLIVLIDGACPLCNRSAAWFARRNRQGAFIFGKNTGEVAKVLGEPHGGDQGTIVVWEGARRLVRSTAVLTLLRALGGGWRWLAILGLGVPCGLRDGVYDFIAQRRHRFSGCTLGARLSPLDLAE
jgi:predicted DCC family thiol-disulfide oxidoreductase YuxK